MKNFFTSTSSVDISAIVLYNGNKKQYPHLNKLVLFNQNYYWGLLNTHIKKYESAEDAAGRLIGSLYQRGLKLTSPKPCEEMVFPVEGKELIIKPFQLKVIGDIFPHFHLGEASYYNGGKKTRITPLMKQVVHSFI